MKKIFSAVGILILLLVIGWCAAAFYTGKQLEKRIDTYVNSLNEFSENNSIVNTHTSYQQYQRGIFSTHLQLQIHKDKQLLLTLESTIEHGPFPLSLLKKFDLTPSIFITTTVKQDQGEWSKLFTSQNNQIQPVATAYASYFNPNKIHFTGQSAIQNDQNKFFSTGFDAAAWQGVVVLTADKNNSLKLANADISGDIKKLKFTMSGKTIATAENLSFSDQWQGIKLSGIYSGTNKYKLDKIRFYIQDEKLFSEINSLEQKYAATLVNSETAVDLTGELLIKGVTIKNPDNQQQQSIGDGELSININSIDIGALINIIDYVKNEMKKTNSSLNKVTGEIINRIDNHDQQTLESLILPFTKQRPSLNINKLSWHTEKGSLNYHFDVALKDVSAGISAQMDNVTLIKTLVQSQNSKLVLPKAALIHLFTQGQRITHNESEQNAQQSAQTSVNELANLGELFQLTRQDNDNITSELNYADGQVSFNGKTMSLEQFISMIEQ